MWLFCIFECVYQRDTSIVFGVVADVLTDASLLVIVARFRYVAATLNSTSFCAVLNASAFHAATMLL